MPIVCRKDPALDMSLIRGVNGFDFTTDEEFQKAMLPLLDDASLRHDMGIAALESVDKFSLPRFADNLVRVFDDVVRKRAEKDRIGS